MTVASTARFALSCVLTLAACASPSSAPPDANTADTGVSPRPSSPDATSTMDAHAQDATAVMDASAADGAAPTDAPTDATRPSTDACVADGGNPSLRFAEVYRRTINDGTGLGCTSSSRCHGRPGEFFDLSTESAAYESLLGVMGACGTRVTPCDSSNSYLSRLMHNPDTCRGQRHTGMFQTMTAEQIALLDAWILGGAQR